MKKCVKGLLAAAAMLGAVAAAPARAVDVKAGSWDLSLTGIVNAFATYRVCGVNGDTANGGIACSRAKDAPNVFSIESGLLPNAIVFTAKTRQYNLDISGTVGMYPGLHAFATGTGTAGPLAGIDVRQGFLTFGDKSWGTVKIGKDLGLFGSDAILSDMLLLGVGGFADSPANTTLGHIGTGYLYADWLPQFAYISPSFSGLQLSLAVVEAFRTAQVNAPAGFAGETPGVQAKATYDLTGPVSGRVWVGGMYQNAKLSAPPANPSLDSVAGEAGVKVNASGLGALGYGYYGSGVGTTFLFGAFNRLVGGTANGDAGAVFDAVNNRFNTRKSYGFYGQVTYAIPNTKLKPGVSYGMSYLDKAAGEGAEADGNVKYNALASAVLFYSLTDSLTLLAEYDHTRTKTHADGLSKDNMFAVGGIIFF